VVLGLPQGAHARERLLPDAGLVQRARADDLLGHAREVGRVDHLRLTRLDPVLLQRVEDLFAEVAHVARVDRLAVDADLGRVRLLPPEETHAPILLPFSAATPGKLLRTPDDRKGSHVPSHRSPPDRAATALRPGPRRSGDGAGTAGRQV